jgi:hypothetical protein
MKFAVWRLNISESRHWPLIVECDADTPADEIVRECFRKNGWPDYEPKFKSYIVAPLNEAMVVSFPPPPPPQYQIQIDPYI